MPRGFMEHISQYTKIMMRVKKDANGCLLWQGALTETGYGHTPKGRAHRVVWIESNGPIPDGMHVLHKCDVRNCVNLEHLFLGTDKDNKDDMNNKGRLTRDIETGQYKTPENVNQEVLSDN